MSLDDILWQYVAVDDMLHDRLQCANDGFTGGSVVKLGQQGDTPLDPVTLLEVGGQPDVHHEVGGVAGGGEHSSAG